MILRCKICQLYRLPSGYWAKQPPKQKQASGPVVEVYCSLCFRQSEQDFKAHL